MTINLKYCIQRIANTGKGTCPFDLSLLLGFFAVPKGTKFTQAQAATVIALLLAGASVDDKMARFYPIGQAVGMEQAGETDTTANLPYGGSKFLKRGLPMFTLRFDNGMGYHKKMAGGWHNSQASWDFFPVFKEASSGYMLGGVAVADEAGLLEHHPWKMQQVSVLTPTLATGSEATIYRIAFTLADAAYINENFGLISLDENPLDLVEGLIDVNLQGTPTGTTGQIAVQALAETQNLHDQFATELAVVGAWKATNADTGATIVVSAVASTAEGWTLTTPAASGVRVKLSMVAPSLLEGLDVPGYESDTIIVTIP